MTPPRWLFSVSSSPCTTLNTLRPGECATVVGVMGDDAITQRLLEMGVIAGAAVGVVRFAPLGDPMEITLDGYHLSLRKTEAALIQVCP